MAIHRIDRKGKKSGGYTLIGNDVINDPRLTFLAVGLLLWMLSLPETWHFSLEGIYAWAVKYGHKAGETAIKNAILSLESAGYLYRPSEKVRGPDGRWTKANWEVFKSPQDNPHYSLVGPKADNPPMETPSPVIPAEAHPVADTPPTENPAGINTTVTNTISKNTNLINYSLNKSSQNQSTIDAAELAAANEDVKNEIGYDEILSSRPESAGLLDVIVHEIATVELSDDAYVRIGKEKIRREKAVSHYYALTAVHVIKVIDSIEAAPYEIKHLDSYVRKALYNAVQDFRTPE